ncbi:MAG: amidohydrolase family protein [Proteobacteria bacterium]|nr:amidohydrolase family protein [Pseudomonadota bacterium]
MNKADWLAQVEEEILEPDLKICDPHHHLWDDPQNPYMFERLLADISAGHNVTSTVFMECASMYRAHGDEALKPVGETEFVNGVAAMSASGKYGSAQVCASIVGFADLSLGAAVGDVLDAHMAASSRFVGIRHASGWHASDAIRNSHTQPPPHLLGDATFREGLKELGRRGLSFDSWLYHEQIPELTNLADAFPDQLIVLDHFGGPLGIGPYAGKREAVFDAWQHAITELAQRDNVVVKIGGLAMPVNGFDFHKAARPPSSQELCEHTKPYYLHTIEAFGPSRCMFESNFPVDKQSCSYVVLWNSFKRIAAGFSASEKAALFHDNAARVYRV